MACLCEQIAGNDIALSGTCIGHLWMFENLRPAEIDALGKEATRRRLDAGGVLFRQGDPADEMMLIKGGRVKLNKVLEDGTEITLDIRKAGDFVGENMLAETGVYPVSAHCLEATLCCGFSRRQFEALVLKNPNIGLQIIRSLSERITWLTTRVGSMTVTSIEERLYRVLSDVASEHGTPGPRGRAVQFSLTHEDLSFLIGAHRVSITRAMKHLRAAGKIIVDGKQIILPRLAG